MGQLSANRPNVTEQADLISSLISSKLLSIQQSVSAAISTESHSTMMKINPFNDKMYVTDPGLLLKRNTTYRFRILNTHFDAIYANVSFAAYYTTIRNPNGTTSYL